MFCLVFNMLLLSASEPQTFSYVLALHQQPFGKTLSGLPFVSWFVAVAIEDQGCLGFLSEET